jgi:hypothetical protein
MKNEALIPQLKKHEFRVLNSKCIVDGIRRKLGEDFRDEAYRKYKGVKFLVEDTLYEVKWFLMFKDNFRLVLIGQIVTEDKKLEAAANKIFNNFNDQVWQLHSRHRPELFVTKEYTISIDLITKEPNLAI